MQDVDAPEAQQAGRSPSLRARLLALVCAIGLPLIGLSGYAVSQAYAEARERAAQMLRDQTRAMALQVDGEFSRAETLLRTLGASRALAAGDLPAFEREASAAAQALSGAAVELLDADGRLLGGTVARVGSGPAAGLSATARQALQTGDVSWSDFEIDPATGQAAILLYLPLAMPGGRLRLLAVQLPNRVLTDVLLGQRLPGDRVAAVLDRRAQVVARARREEALLGRPATPRVRAALAQSDDGVLHGVINQDGVASVIAYVRAPRSGYAVVTALPEEEFNAPLRSALWRTLLLGATVLALALLAAYRIAQRVIVALDRVAQASRAGASVPPPSLTGLRETDVLATTLAAAAREREQANRAKDAFLATLSHELRTPLHAITGWTQLLQHPGFDPARRDKAIAAIERNARAQARLIDDLLDMTRIESGKLEIRRAPLQLSEVIDAAVAAVQPTAAARDVAIELDVEPVDAVLGDAPRLQQVVWNLLGNAVKFSEHGSRVQLRLRGEAGIAVLSVIDQGAGIEPAFLSQVFERFRQADDSATRQHGGLGLGLAIARSIVAMHGGDISAHSEGRGRGATFTLRLPTVVNGAAVIRADAAAEGASLAGLRVLCVDDDDDGRDMIVAVLQRAGAAVESAPSVAEAVARLRDWPADLVVSDIAMPGTDGFTLARVLRQRAQDAGAPAPKLVALTALASASDVQRAQDAGFDAHLAKPVDAEALLRVCAALAAQGPPARAT